MKHKKLTILSLGVIILILGGIVALRNFFPTFPQVNLTLEKNKNVGLQEGIVIDFSLPVKKENYGKNIRIEPSLRATVEWQNNYQKLIITPVDKWKMETNYKISLPQGRSLFFSKIEARSFNFSTPNYPKVISVFPLEGAQDIVLGMEDPLVINFDQSLNKFSLKFLLNPGVEVVYQAGDSDKQIKLLPKTPLLAGQKYEVRTLVKAQEEKEIDFKEIHQTSFETLPPTPENWEKDFTLRLEQARKYTRAKFSTGRYIDINLTSQIMSIFEEGKLIDSFMVSTGKRGMDTQKGSYTIHNKSPRVWSKKYGLWMPFWMAVASDGSFGIHELPEWPGGYKEGANHLGTPVSHGCIRLGVGAAKIVYDFTTVGTPVVIY